MAKKNAAAVALAARRMIKLSKERRSEIASVAGRARIASMTKAERKEMSAKGGTVGGAARAAKLTAEKRKEIARAAAAVRWAKTKQEK